MITPKETEGLLEGKQIEFAEVSNTCLILHLVGGDIVEFIACGPYPTSLDITPMETINGPRS